MAELNIPMRTKGSMELGTAFEQKRDERVQAALDLRDVQNGMQQRAGTAERRQSSSGMPPVQGQRGAMNQGLPPVQNQRGAMNQGLPPRQGQPGTPRNGRREAAHYEVRAEGGTVLHKGGKVSFSSLLPGRLGKIDVVMGWDAEAFSPEDVDASCFMLGENGQVVGDDWFVFYNQPSSPDGSVRHLGKNGREKKEKIVVDFLRLSQQVKRLAFVLTINEARERGWSFSQMGNAHVRMKDSAGGKELALFNLSDYYEGVTAMTVCEFYAYHGEWKINPVGHGLKDTGLLELCRFYGVQVE